MGVWQDMQWVCVVGVWVCGKICSGCVVATHTVYTCMWCVVLELAVVIHGMTA